MERINEYYSEMAGKYDEQFGGHMKEELTAFGYSLDSRSYTKAEQIEIMLRCLRDNKLWYEYIRIYLKM